MRALEAAGAAADGGDAGKQQTGPAVSDCGVGATAAREQQRAMRAVVERDAPVAHHHSLRRIAPQFGVWQRRAVRPVEVLRHQAPLHRQQRQRLAHPIRARDAAFAGRQMDICVKPMKRFVHVQSARPDGDGRAATRLRRERQVAVTRLSRRGR